MYIVLELQLSANGTLAHIATVKNTFEDALETYYQTLMYACKSTLPSHGVMIISSEGEVEKAEFYKHVSSE